MSRTEVAHEFFLKLVRRCASLSNLILDEA
jgi:hypothetical protein